MSIPWQQPALVAALPQRVARIGLATGEGDDLSVSTSKIQGAGLGLFTAKGKSKGEVITWYDGDVVDRRAALALKAAGRASHVRTLTAWFCYVDGLKVPMPDRGVGSFANDDFGNVGGGNNACYKLVHIKEWASNVVVLRATRDIPPGGEVLVSYGAGYWAS